MRRAAKRIAITAAAAAGGAALERFFLAAPRYRGPRSDHFDGRRFHNPEPTRQSERAFLKWQFTRQPGRWRDIDPPPGPPPPARVEKGDLRVTFINHSTTLLQFDGVNILTDPVWSRRVSPFPFAGPRRHRPPGIRFDDLRVFVESLPSLHEVVLAQTYPEPFTHLDVRDEQVVHVLRGEVSFAGLHSKE